MSFLSNIVSIKCRFDQVSFDQVSFNQMSGHDLSEGVNASLKGEKN